MKQYGIRITLPEDSTMAMAHLLGDNWEAFRWFDTAEERDRNFKEMQRQPYNYRIGDNIQQILNKVERGH
ncbi:MAG TPA: hypothetical protein EYH06_09010 [Chromatiales bacterium]|nr:hypothetical protein [Thiotrichales bacterium]HIP68715.1 hypothetical protein [Chromatiales bacterium]